MGIEETHLLVTLELVEETHVLFLLEDWMPDGSRLRGTSCYVGLAGYVVVLQQVSARQPSSDDAMHRVWKE